MAPQTDSVILVVEDEAQIRDLIVGELTARGYACVAVTSVAEAGARLSQRSFRLILLDLILRDGSGLDLLRTIQDTPVLVVSGAPNPVLREAAASRSVRAILTKPFSLLELRDKVAHCLEAGTDRQDGPGIPGVRAWELGPAHGPEIEVDGPEMPGVRAWGSGPSNGPEIMGAGPEMKAAGTPTPETVGTVAHALKNLLAVAIGEVEFLLSEEARHDPGLQRQGLESIRRAVLDSRQLIWRLEGLAGMTAPPSTSRL